MCFALLLERGRCFQHGCFCAVYILGRVGPSGVYEEMVTQPTAAHDRCTGCDHEWYYHEATTIPSTHRNYTFRRGTLSITHCGGFFSNDEVWSVSSICVCGGRWVQHSLAAPALQSFTASNPTSQPQLTLAPPAQTNVPLPGLPHPRGPSALGAGFATSPPTLSSVIAAAPPIQAFTGLPPLAPATNVASQRTASALRSLPQHQTRTSVAPNRLPPARTSSTSRGGGGRGTRARNPYPVGGSMSSRAQFVTDSQEPKPYEFTFAVIPLTLNADFILPECPAPKLIYTSDQMVPFLERLGTCGLLAEVTIPANTPEDSVIWEDITTQLSLHMTTNGLSVARRQGATTDTNVAFHELWWYFLHLARQTVDGRHVKQYEIVGHQCTLKDLAKFSAKRANVNPLSSTKSLFLVGPRFGNVTGPLPVVRSLASGMDVSSTANSLSLHACFAFRVMEEHVFNRDALEDYFKCNQHCPQGIDGHSVAPATSESVTLASSSGHHHTTTSNLRRPRSASADDDYVPSGPPSLRHGSHEQDHNDGAFIRSTPPLTWSSHQPVLNTAENVDADVTGLDNEVEVNANVGPALVAWTPVHQASSHDLQTWRSLCINDVFIANDEVVSFRGESEVVIAQAIIDYFVWLYTPKTDRLLLFTPSGDVECNCSPLHAFLHSMRLYSIPLPDGNNFVSGPGLELAIWQHVLRLVLEDKAYWQSHGPFRILLPHTAPEAIPKRQIRCKVYGTIVALYQVITAECPGNVSPFLLLTIINNPKTYILDMDFIGHFDPRTAGLLLPWHALSPDSPIPRGFGTPFSDLMIGELNRMPCTFDDNRSELEHESVTRGLQHHLLYQSAAFFYHPDVQAFRDGYNILIHPGRHLIDTFSSFKLSHTTPAAIIAAQYSRDVTDPFQVADHLDFIVQGQVDHPLAPLFEDLLELRMRQWLLGQGHVDHPEIRGQLITEDEYLKEVGNRTFRASLLLLAATHSPRRKCDDYSGVTINISHEEIELGIPYQSSLTMAGLGLAPQITFHTCTSAVDIQINRWCSLYEVAILDLFFKLSTCFTLKGKCTRVGVRRCLTAVVNPLERLCLSPRRPLLLVSSSHSVVLVQARFERGAAILDNPFAYPTHPSSSPIHVFVLAEGLVLAGRLRTEMCVGPAVACSLRNVDVERALLLDSTVLHGALVILESGA
ncbi:hypothetical protein BD410DRAFT_809809 [Rickenella mellea]|uniref:Uncharacterized protein n=1 Tax=Rickenella mellea TaxID=50990 RepID=A0A4Y7PFX5_9AGAM|nr:hypothetical protein BD410DRAFT_809809 [Rickenella mellea]